MDDSSKIKESKVIARLLHEHILRGHKALGAIEESAGMVDLIYHPELSLPDLNFATPRRNTAFIQAKAIDDGLNRLRAMHRKPRFCYLDMLFPSHFEDMILKVGLQLENRSALMLYKADGLGGTIPTRPLIPPLPEDMQILEMRGEHTARLWREMPTDSHFTVWRLGYMPLALDGASSALQTDEQFDLVTYRGSVPVGIIRLDMLPDQGTLHLLALAVRNGPDAAIMRQAMMAAAMRTGIKRGCPIIFAGCYNETPRAVCRAAGLTHFCSGVVYAAGRGNGDEGNQYGPVEQPVLTLKS